MALSKFLNRLLLPFDLAIARRSTLDKFHLSLDSKLQVDDSKIQITENSIENLNKKMEVLRKDSLRTSIALYWRLIDQIYSLQTEPQEIQCELCGYTASEIYFKKYYSSCMFGGGRLIRHQCPTCDVIFGPQKILKLTDEELSQEYNLHYSTYQEGESIEREIRTFNSLKPSKDGIYLNYGSGSWSSTVPALRQAGWNILAYEPHAAAATRDWCISNANELENMRFDGIFTNNVLEHFRDPVQELKKISKLLKPTARMAHATPCYEYLYEFTRFHLFFFVGGSRDYMIEKAGLRQEEFIVDGDFMNLILLRIEP